MQLDSDIITIDPAAAPARTSDLCALTQAPSRQSVVEPLSTEPPRALSSLLAFPADVIDSAVQTTDPARSDSVVSLSPPPAPAPSPSSPSVVSAVTPDSERIRSQRLAIVHAVDAHVTQHGCSVSAACRELKISQSTYARYSAALAAGGPDALLSRYDNCGRKSTLDLLCPEEDRAWLIAELKRLNGLGRSAQIAADRIAREPECPPAIAAYLQRAGRIPRSILRAARLNPQQRARFAGPRNYKLHSFVNLRMMTVVHDNGAQVELKPGDVWEFDDMSLNNHFWWNLPAGSEDRTATVDGVALGRQGLYCMDVGSGKWIGHILIGRSRDAYKAEDILRFIRMLMMIHGKPRIGIRLERGIWRSNRIKGSTLTPEIAPLAASEQDIVAAGIRDLGIKVDYCYDPHTKGLIESSFRYFQNVMATTDLPDIGRTRGEGEAATKALLRCKSGSVHPSTQGFPHIDECSNVVAWAENWCNTKHKNGRLIKGIPDERWLSSITLDPLRKLTPSDHAIFLPERSEKMIRGGHIILVRDATSYAFTDPELFAELGDGFHLLCAFDPAEPELGCGLWNNETSSANIRNWSLGHFIGYAKYEPMSPQFGRSADTRGADNRRAYNNWHRTAFAALQPGQPATTHTSLRDGHGRTVHVTRDQVAPAHMPALAPARTSSSPVAAPLGASAVDPSLRSSASFAVKSPDSEEPIAVVRIIHRNPKPVEAIHVKRIYH